MHPIWILKIEENDLRFSKELLLEKLPETLSVKANRYLDTQSALSFIGGRLLLKNALTQKGLSSSLLEKIRYSEHGKPSFEGHHFSLSHSNWYVVLVFGTAFPVGIDIEMKKNIDLKLFEYLFTTEEWNTIVTAKNSMDRFYWFWVRKEALLKAVGCSLKALKELEVFEDYGIYKNKHYYFEPFEFNTSFNGMIAMEKKERFKVKMLSFSDLLKE